MHFLRNLEGASLEGLRRVVLAYRGLGVLRNLGSIQLKIAFGLSFELVLKVADFLQVLLVVRHGLIQLQVEVRNIEILVAQHLRERVDFLLVLSQLDVLVTDFFLQRQLATL